MEQHTISKAAVIGAGVMGADIAAVIANAGIPVCLLDIVPPQFTDEDKKAGLSESSPAYRNKFALSGLRRISNPKRGSLFTPQLASLIQVGNLEDSLHLLQDCDWVVEVVLEDLQVKRDLLKKIAPYCKDTAFISSNTSGVSITAIAAEMPDDFRRRFLGTHFFNPPRQMRLFELIPGADTDPNIVKAMANFGKRRLGKGVVTAKDTPNFIGNRIGVYAFASVYRATEEFGFDIETVDQLTGTVLGRPKSATFRTIDMVGIDVLHHVCANLQKNLPAGETKILVFPSFLQDLYEKKYWGDKTGGGCYKTIIRDGITQKLVWNDIDYVPVCKPHIPLLEETRQLPFDQRLWTIIDSPTPEGKFVWRVLKEILLYSASRVPEIADNYTVIDQAMEWGYNWQLGPYALWDKLGFVKVATRLATEGAVLPAWVQERLTAEIDFYPETAATPTVTHPAIRMDDVANLIDLGDGVLCLNMHSRGSAITPALMDAIHAAIDEMEQNPVVKGLVLSSAGKNFLNGADLYTMSGYIRREEWDKIEELSAQFQATSLRLKYTKKPIVAAVHGMALGGGLEFAMHCPCVVAHCESNMGLVEANVGVLPAGGGTKELLYRWFSKLDGITEIDLFPVLRKVWELIATAQVSKNAMDAMAMCYLRPTDRIVMDIDILVEEAKGEVLRMNANGFRQAYPFPIRVTGTTGYGYLSSIIEMMLCGKFITIHDAVIAREIAYVLTGGDVPRDSMLNEELLLLLEKRGITRLCHQEKTMTRMEGMLKTGKPLRN